MGEQEEKRSTEGGGEGQPESAEELKQVLAAANARAGELEHKLREKESEAAALKIGVSDLEAKVGMLDGSLTAAIDGYRTLIARANPDILPELVRGATLVEIDESVEQAREIVARVKKGFEEGVARRRFPAGSPERGGLQPDLSPREKIERGIGR